MGNEARKNSKPPDISASQIIALKKEVEELSKIVAEHFDEKNYWNSMVRDWIGKDVLVHLTGLEGVFGMLLWIDRYTMCLVESSTKTPVIIHKAAIMTIRPRFNLPDKTT